MEPFCACALGAFLTERNRNGYAVPAVQDGTPIPNGPRSSGVPERLRRHIAPWTIPPRRCQSHLGRCGFLPMPVPCTLTMNLVRCERNRPGPIARTMLPGVLGRDARGHGSTAAHEVVLRIVDVHGGARLGAADDSRR